MRTRMTGAMSSSRVLVRYPNTQSMWRSCQYPLAHSTYCMWTRAGGSTLHPGTTTPWPPPATPDAMGEKDSRVLIILLRFRTAGVRVRVFCINQVWFVSRCYFNFSCKLLYMTLELLHFTSNLLNSSQAGEARTCAHAHGTHSLPLVTVETTIIFRLILPCESRLSRGGGRG